MLRTQERNSVAVLYQVTSRLEILEILTILQNIMHSNHYPCCCQGPESGIAPAVEKPTMWCEGKLCKAGKCGLAKSSSSFQVNNIHKADRVSKYIYVD